MNASVLFARLPLRRRSNYERALGAIFRIGKKGLKKRYANRLFEQLNGEVIQGPFQGLRLIGRSVWSNDIVSMLVGEYESELSFMFEASELSRHDVFVNLGSADGYFAVGVALKSPLCVIAYETSRGSRSIARSNAVLNKVEHKIVFRAEALSADLCNSVSKYHKPLLLIDIEGSELALFDDAVCDALSNATIVLEDHLVQGRSTADEIAERLANSHRAEPILQTPRNPFRHPNLAGFSEDFKYLMLSEERGSDARWLILRPLADRTDAERTVERHP